MNPEEFKKFEKRRNTRLLLFFILAPFAIYCLIRFSKNQSVNEEISGVVVELNYDGHGNPEVKFKEGDFNNLLLFSFGGNERNLKVGDSIYKKRGEEFLFHYKKNDSNNYFLYRTYKY
ncbi:hypothetical protein [Lacinutrix algicola]|uniref:hypothetical protein n=1 Tax=Lacinutrix algicola TaxID=342954 RepID=UPI0006E35000|nr:hypothetical protein [Lacinutrix algicola]